jgi:hypothetical protein
MVQRREALGFVGAVLAHAAGLPLLAIVPIRRPSGETPSDGATSIEIETAPADPVPVAPPLPSPAPVSEPPFGAPLAAATKIRTPTGVATRATDETVTDREPDDRIDPGAAAWLGGAPPPMRTSPLGAGRGVGVQAAPSGPHPVEQGGLDPGRDSARLENGVRDALVARDHDLGLDAAGALVALAEDCVRHGDTPLEGKAYFDVMIGADGTVASVVPIASTGPASDARLWEGLAASLRESGRSRAVLWRRTGKPLRVRLEVSSRWVTPSGARPGRPLTPMHGKLSETWDTPGATGFAPAVPLAPAAVAAGTHFDVSDLGSRALRDVHARILKEDSP